MPRFTEEFFEKIAATFNASEEIGIAFNSYNAFEGQEVVHLNPVALEALNRASHRTRTQYAGISGDDVRDALWIYQYGFKNRRKLDGCYFRQVMLSELTCVDRIFVSRPVNFKWDGPMPTNWIEAEDLKTEVMFNGLYQGERDKLLLVNKLLADGKLDSRRYGRIDLHELEIMVRAATSTIFSRICGPSRQRASRQ